DGTGGAPGPGAAPCFENEVSRVDVFDGNGVGGEVVELLLADAGGTCHAGAGEGVRNEGGTVDAVGAGAVLIATTEIVGSPDEELSALDGGTGVAARGGLSTG